VADAAGADGRQPIVSVRSVTRVIGARTIVDAVSFDIAEGEVVAILGPSGSGKTSLLRMIAGFDAPSAGSISLFGSEVSTAGQVRVAPEHRTLAIAFQDATLYPHLDAVGNVAFAIRHARPAERKRKARDELASMGVVDSDGRDVATLSGGEAQRVSLARALAARARLLLLDEPFGNVDRLTRKDLIARLQTRLASVAGAIFITHDAADAVELGARVLLMRGGRLVADGRPADLVAGAAGDWARDYLRAESPVELRPASADR
jgi:ABC-type Fe3+/spermidine/putrescine transport system ATPase subunit